MGNVLVRWDPHFIVSNAFPEREDHAGLVQSIFKHKTWLDHNLGYITQHEAINQYHHRLGIEKEHLEQMMVIVKQSLIPIKGSFELLHSLHAAQFNLYALTDNTKDIMAYLKEKYDFWNVFQGIVVSAEVGHLKPSREIYHHLLDKYDLQPQETVFIDDYLVNVEGARTLGIHAIQFKNAEQCMQELLGLNIKGVKYVR